MKRQSEDFEDSIIGDVRRARAQLLARVNNDLRLLCEHIKAEQAKHPERVVNLHKQPR